MDYISIDNLEVFANHGVLKEENHLGQKFYISAVLYYDFENASTEDDINMAVNYAQVCSFMSEYMKNNTFRLIETVADRLAIQLLLNYPILQKVKVTVKKPWAPIGLPVDNVMATVIRKWNDVCLSIGSNMGDKADNLDYAVRKISNDELFKDVVTSDYYVTKPYGGVEQDDFQNGAIRCKTLLSARKLLEYIHITEKERGRVRDIHWGPRTLDIDILFYNDEIIDEEDLTIPHPDMSNRLFVLEPLSSIAPYYVHPVLRKTVMTMKAELPEE